MIAVAGVPGDNTFCYAGAASGGIFKFIDGGITWEPVFDEQPVSSIGSLAIAPSDPNIVWAGTGETFIRNDVSVGNGIYKSTDAGKHWTHMGLEKTGRIDRIVIHPKNSDVVFAAEVGHGHGPQQVEPSRFHAGTCYFSADLHEMNHWDTYVYKTTDFGESWEMINGDIPEGPLSYAHRVREDSVREGLLYLGTENMLYVSFNDGDNWMPLQEGMPHAPVHWLVIQEHFNDLVVGTYGRGFYILDPPYGALVNYYLKSKPQNDVTIAVSDTQGRTVDTIKGTNHVGINRVVWDLRYETLRSPKLRTPPIEAPWVEVGREGWRPLVTWGQPTDVKVAPGVYTLGLRVDGKEFKQELIVEKDPHSEGTIEDIKEQTDLLLKIRKDVDDLIGMINQVEWIRKQLYNLVDIIEKTNDSEDIVEEAGSLDDKFIEVEKHLFQMKLTGAGQDALRWPAQLYVKFTSLADEIMMADFKPTDQQVELYEVLKNRLETHQATLNELLSNAIPAFNVTLEIKGISSIVLVKK